MKKKTFIQKVREILEEEFNRPGNETNSVSMYYLVEELQNRVSPIELRNRAASDNNATSSAEQNLLRGAKKVARDALNGMRREYFVLEDKISIVRIDDPRAKPFLNPHGGDLWPLDHKLELDGVERTIVEWGEVVGIKPTTIRRRIQELGWSIERALTEPLATQREEMLILIPREGEIEREKLKSLFLKKVSDESALKAAESRKKREIRKNPAAAKTWANRSREEIIEIGKVCKFNIKLGNLVTAKKAVRVGPRGGKIRRWLPEDDFDD